MPIVDRLEFPKRYKLKGSMLIFILLVAAAGIWMQNQNLKKSASQIQISQVQIVRTGTGFIELEYNIANLGKQDKDVNLMARVWDVEGLELASALFNIQLSAKSQGKRTKMLDKLNRSLKEGEKPFKAEISLYTRKVP